MLAAPSAEAALPDVECGRLSRLVASVRLRRAVPLAVSLPALRLLTAVLFRVRPSLRRLVEGEMRHILSATPRAAEAPRLAAAHLYDTAVTTDLRWRPWIVADTTLRGREHLDAARREGGVIVAFCHTGVWTGLYAALRNAGVACTAPLTAAAFAPRLFGFIGLLIRQDRALAAAGAAEVIAADGSYARLRDVLRGGGVVAIAVDVAGDAQVAVLGRTARLASGVARLAVETGSPVVFATVRRERRRLVAILDPALPAGADVGALHARLGERATQRILERPEALEFPSQRFTFVD